MMNHLLRRFRAKRFEWERYLTSHASDSRHGARTCWNRLHTSSPRAPLLHENQFKWKSNFQMWKQSFYLLRLLKSHEQEFSPRMFTGSKFMSCKIEILFFSLLSSVSHTSLKRFSNSSSVLQTNVKVPWIYALSHSCTLKRFFVTWFQLCHIELFY